MGLEATPLTGAEFGAKMQETYVTAEPIMKAMIK